jgi:hypothetical protein
VLIGEVPVPGVVVTAVQGDKKVTAATNASGTYSFADLADGVWTIQIEMTGFAPVREDVTVSATGSTSTFALKMLPLTQIKTEPVNGFVASTAAPQLLQALSPADAAEDGAITQELRQRAADGLLINGSISNGASTPFALNPAFGNNRRGFRSPYNGLVSISETMQRWMRDRSR